MTTELDAPLLFAAHLFALLVAVGSAFAMARERDRGAVARAAGALGFAALAVGEAYHGAAFGGETAAVSVWSRAVGFALLIAAAAVPARSHGVAAVGGGAGTSVIPPAALGLAAGVLTGWRRRREPGGLWLAAGIVLLGVADAALALREPWSAAASHGIRVAGYVAVGRFVVALTSQSVRFRFMVGFAGLLLAVILIVASAVSTVIGRNLEAETLSRLGSQAEEAQLRMRQFVAARAGTLKLVGETRTIADFLQDGQRIPREVDLQEIRRRVLPQVGFIIFTDVRGRLLGFDGVPPATAVDVVASDVVAAARDSGQIQPSLDALPASEELALIAAAPVEVTGGGDRARVIGLAIGGNRLDQQFLEQQVVAGSGVGAAAYLGLRGRPPVLVSTAGFPEGAGDEPLLPDSVLRGVFERFRGGGGPEGRLLEVGGIEHFAALAPLRREDDAAVGILVVAEPATVLGETQREVNQVLFLLTLVVVGLAFLAAALAARRITRPIVSLTRAARRVQAGDLETRAEPRGEDEVADLAYAFNRMTESVSDMTGELRQAAEEQARLRARLETVVNSMGDGLIAVNDAGRVVTYNPAAGAIVGVPRSRVLGKPLKEILHARDAGGRPLPVRKTVPTGMAFVRRPGGEEIPVAISSSPLMDGAGEPLGRVYVFRDMSREHEIERMKSEFLSNVSHELRTPLTPIIGYSEILHRRDVPARKARDFASGILESARRLERIVAMLVDFSAIEAGRMSVTMEPVSLRPVIVRAVDSWRRKAPRHRVTARIRPRLPNAMADLPLISRILDELIDNAVKYSPDGGRVSVRLSEDQERPRNGKKRRMLRVDVIDQGIGIDPEDLARIFQDFRQVDASDTRPFGGLGLGLAFVQRVVEAHGGTITAASQPGKGSTFTFTVPAADRDMERSRRKR